MYTLSQVKIYVLTIVASRPNITTSRPDYLSVETGGKTSFTAQESERDALDEAFRIAYDAYPLTEGWMGHAVDVFELPQEIGVDGHRVMWQIAPVIVSEEH